VVVIDMTRRERRWHDTRVVDIADWGRPNPFGTAAIATYRRGDELIDDLLDAVARRLDGDPAGFDAVRHRLGTTPDAAAPVLVRAIHRLPLDPLATQILGFTLAWELSPTLHRRLAEARADLAEDGMLRHAGGAAGVPAGIARETLIAWCDPPSPRAVGHALHPAAPLVGFELVTVDETGPWFAHAVRATPAACRLATAPDDPDEVDLPTLGAADPRLVDAFAAPGPTITLVRGDRALDAVLAAAAEAGARVCVGGTPERSLAAAIRDACLLDRMPVLICERADLIDRRLLARISGPRCIILAGTGPLALVTTA
jgi:hypothetical protein